MPVDHALRPLRSALLTDRPADIFRFLRDAMIEGRRCALVTLVEIIDGASRALGAHMAVSEDGSYCGFVSGGCVEAAVAREALEAISTGSDRVCRLGKGSPYFDIVLACGGGIRLTIHVLRTPDCLDAVLAAMAARKSIGLAYDPHRQTLSLDEAPTTGWHDGSFTSVYRPDPQILLSGTGLESLSLTKAARAVDLDIVQADADLVYSSADRDTAIVLLHHDIEKELPVLRSALRSEAFYIGCLGSRRTHARRREILQQQGYSSEQLQRIHAPIGLFGPARDARSLAVSVLADILSHVERRRQEAISLGQ
ncbi:XdhC family protein [Ancylobacter polymorphus]|uniref:XdhC family protein n=1 Tax=Ancylobacter polymorphus TaxID=223390 RepID=A0A9E6ZX49_9HYPH|nr:XdhC family protein [Ancylobacter polymorphus]UOK73376.1 XdhC family protein [Ancylobacter polymorphus]